MTCTEVRELLWEYAFDLLEPGQGKRVEKHVQECAGCAQELRRLRQILGSWKEVPAPAGLSERLLRAAESFVGEGQAEPRPEPVMAAEATPGGPPPLPRRATVSPWPAVGRWALAAGLILGVLLSGTYLFLARLAPERQDTVVVAPPRLLLPAPQAGAASPGAMRVTVSDALSGTPVSHASGTLDLVERKQEAFFFDLCRFETDLAGRADARFGLPGHLLPEDSPRSGLYRLRVETSSPTGHDRMSLPILLERAYRLLVETDARVYRPGETVRVRGLVVDEVMLQPQPYVTVELELRDGEGRTQVTAHIPSTRWALFSGELSLPADLAAGTYQLVASAGGSSFAQAVDVIAGEDDSAGAAAGLRPAASKAAGKAMSAGTESAVATSLRVLVRPEAGVLVPGVENHLYVLVTDADGRPASAKVTLRSQDAPALTERTDEAGVALFTLRPSAGGFSGTLLAKADAGQERQVEVSLPAPDPPARVLLRLERWYYRSGEPIRLTFLAARDVSTVFLDVSQNGQLMFTRTVDLTEGATTQDFTFENGLTGLLGLVELRAYPAHGEAIVGSVSRLVCIGPQRSVNVQAEVEPAPEGTGGPRLRLAVRGAEEKAIPALLSVSAALLPAGVEPEPGELMSSYLLGTGEKGVGQSWGERLALADLFSPPLAAGTGDPPAGGLADVDATGLLPPSKDRLCLALLGAGSQLVPGEPKDPATALLVARTSPQKAASVARMQERFLPPLAAGLWSAAALLAVAAIAALIGAVKGPAGALQQTPVILRAAVAGVAAGFIVLAVVPQAERPEVYLGRARLAEAQSAPMVLGPANRSLPGEEGEPVPPFAREPRARLARPETGTRGTHPLRAVLWEPRVETDAAGIALLDLPSLPELSEGWAPGRLQVSVLALVPADGGTATVAEARLVVSVAATGPPAARPGPRAPSREGWAPDAGARQVTGAPLMLSSNRRVGTGP